MVVQNYPNIKFDRGYLTGNDFVFKNGACRNIDSIAMICNDNNRTLNSHTFQCMIIIKTYLECNISAKPHITGYGQMIEFE